MAFPTKQASVVTNPGGTGSTIVPTLPSHAANDEIEIWVTKTGNATWTAPAGWSIARQIVSPGTSSTATVGTLLYRRVLSTDTLPLPSPTCNLGATVTRHAIARTIRGADIEGVYTTPSWSAIGTGSGTANPIRPASVTTPAPEMLVTHYYCQRVATNAPEPSGYTQDQEVITSGTLITNVSQKNVADQNTALTNQDASPTSGGRWVGLVTCAPSIDYPYYRSGSQATATATNVTPALPTGTTAADQRSNKDLVIATVEAAGTAPSPNTPGDWTLIGIWSNTTGGAGATTVGKWWALYDGSLDRQFNRTGSGEISACLTTYYNVHQTTPIGNSDADPRASSTTSTWDALTRLAAKVVVTTTCVADATPSFTSPSGWIERMDGLGIACSDQTFNATGSTAAASFTLSSGSPTLVGLVEVVGLGADVAGPTTLALTTTQFAPSLKLSVTPGINALTLATFAPMVVTGGGDIDVTPGTVSLTITSFNSQLRLAATPTTTSLTTAAFAPQLSLRTTPNTSNLTLAAFAPTVSIGTLVQPASATLSLSAFTVSLHLSITPSTASLSTTNLAPSLRLSVVSATASLTTTQFAPLLPQIVAPSVAALTVTTHSPSLSLVVTPPVATLTVTGIASSLSLTITPATAALVTAQSAPSLIQGFTVTPATAALSISTLAANLSLGLIPSTSFLTLNSFAAKLDIAVRPNAQGLVIQSFAVSLRSALTPQLVTLTLTALSPSITAGLVASPAPANLTTSRFTPSLKLITIPQTRGLSIATFAPSISGIDIDPQTTTLTLAFHAPNIVAFNPRSVIQVSRENRITKVSRETNTIHVSKENNAL